MMHKTEHRTTLDICRIFRDNRLCAKEPQAAACCKSKYPEEWNFCIPEGEPCETDASCSTGLCGGSEEPFTCLPACQRIVAIGDLHGEWYNTIKILIASKIIVEKDASKTKKTPTATDYEWQPENPLDCLLQIGDIIDRGEYSKQLYDLFDLLREQSTGRVINLLGNHEVATLSGEDSIIENYTHPNESKHWAPHKNES